MTIPMKTKEEFLFELGIKIKEKRIEKGYRTTKELCLELADYGLDISDNMFSKYECGSRPISVYRLAILAKELGVKVDDLLPDI